MAADARTARRWCFAGAMIALATAFVACFPAGGAPLLDAEEASAPPTDLDGDGGFFRSDADLGDPFGIDGLTPSHGPFTGGTHARVAGRGFSSKLTIFVGGTLVSREAITASDPTRATIITPPGRPGFVEVKIRDESTAKERVLPNGFYYDALVVQPESGATSGGTRIAITGSGTAWSAASTVKIGGVACKSVVFTSATKLECVTPPGTPGTKDVVVATPGAPGDAANVQARDAFTYSDTTDGYRGGLSGGAFAGTVRVLAFNGFTGAPIPDAFAIGGGSLATAVVRKTSVTGVAELSGLPGSSVTVTVAAECHQPMTFVDVNVDTVTAYLSPVLDIECAKGDPPSTGGGIGRYGSIIEGDLLFPGKGEFERAGWTTVPTPTKPTERRAAYVFTASPSPAAFALPAASEAITPDAIGGAGYSYSIVVLPGNQTVYVVAGLEDRSESPPKFVPYAMGVARGVTVPVQTRITGVDIRMDVLFDHQVSIQAEPPLAGPGAIGPDRLGVNLAVTLGNAGYALVPRGSRVVPLPAPGVLPIVGVPSLDRALAGEQYVLGAAAATGPDLQRPASVISRVRTTNANTPVSLGGFLGIPIPTQPSASTWPGTHVTFSGASGPVDLSVIDIVSGGGLVSWTIVAPGTTKDFDVPDLAALPSTKHLGLVRGAIRSTFYVARINDFAYGRLRLGQLTSNAWNAHAFDAVSGVY